MWNLANNPETTALLLVDVINDLEFDGGDDLLFHALPMAVQLVKLKAQARACGIPVIYANDNFGRWRSDFQKLVHYCLHTDVRGKEIARVLEPHEDDYFVLKPKHSAFYQTSLDVLLKSLGTKRLIITGMAGDICVLFTANDGYMRDFEIIVPADCIASEDAENNRQTLHLIERVLKADITSFAAVQAEQTAS